MSWASLQIIPNIPAVYVSGSSGPQCTWVRLVAGDSQCRFLLGIGIGGKISGLQRSLSVRGAKMANQ